MATNNLLDNADIVSARNEAASAMVRGYGQLKVYTGILNNTFSGLSVKWYKVEHNDKGAEANLVNEEKALFYKALHKAHPEGKYSNPSTVWGRARTLGFELDNPKVEGEAGEGEGEAGEGSDKPNARHNKSLTLRYVDELTTLFKAGRRAEKDGIITSKEQQALTHIASALGALGIDIAQL